VLTSISPQLPSKSAPCRTGGGKSSPESSARAHLLVQPGVARRGPEVRSRPHAEAWAKRYCEELRRYGSRLVRNSLRRRRYRGPQRQEGSEKLLRYLDQQADRLDYPRYEYHLGYPISKGSMDRFCKQLGQ